MREVWWGALTHRRGSLGPGAEAGGVAASPVRAADAGQVLPWSLWPEPGPASTLKFSFPF